MLNNNNEDKLNLEWKKFNYSWQKRPTQKLSLTIASGIGAKCACVCVWYVRKSVSDSINYCEARKAAEQHSNINAGS